MCSLQKKKKKKKKKKKNERVSNFNFPLDLDNSARICSACRIALTSSMYKQSAETFVDVSKHFQFSLFLNWKGTHIFMNISLQISESGFEVRKSRCSVQQ